MKEKITIVAGFPRSGTAMVMRMLEKGGMSILTDYKRIANRFNPNGYYEDQRMRNMGKDQSFLKEAVNKVVKIYRGLLLHLPNDYRYKIILIDRDIGECWMSRQNILKANGQKVNDRFFTVRRQEQFKIIAANVDNWIAQQPNVEVLRVAYKEMVENPLDSAAQINAFLEEELDNEAMARVVDPALYHEKGPFKFITTDRAPVEIANVVDQYAKDKVYCEIGIGEGHTLEAVKTPSKKFGVENNNYGLNRVKKLYPHLEIKGGDVLEIFPVLQFDVCYMWITYPPTRDIVNMILDKKPDTIVLMGLNYFYHLPPDDEKRKNYEKAYPPIAEPTKWNQYIDEHLAELQSKGFQHEIVQVTGSNDEIFSIAVIQKAKEG